MNKEMVKVRTLCRLSESAVIYEPGQIFETSKDRAEALGDSVEIVTGEEKAEPKAKAKAKK